MPKRLKCCDPHCNDQVVCSPSEKPLWEVADDGETYGTNACGGYRGEGLCSDIIRMDWNFDLAYPVCYQSQGADCAECFSCTQYCEGCTDPPYGLCNGDEEEPCVEETTYCFGSDPYENLACRCGTFNGFEGHFKWEDFAGTGGQSAYEVQWNGCDGQPEYYGVAPNCDTGNGEMSYCFGNYNNQGGPCPVATGSGFGGCSDSVNGMADVTVGGGALGCSSVIDATWYASGFNIHGDASLFNPYTQSDACSNYRTMLRRITLQSTGGQLHTGCRVTWYFSGNPTTGGTTETCFYHDYGSFSTNEFGELETGWDLQSKYGLYGSGGSTKLFLQARIEGGDNTKIYDITNGESVQVYYKKPRRYFYSMTFAHCNSCIGTEGSLYCDFDYCEDGIDEAHIIGYAYSPYAQILTSDHGDVDDCPNGSVFGGSWTWDSNQPNTAAIQFYISHGITVS